ncbi:mitochondrial amino-acid acetyltransferase [Phyllosticta capitalensis]|uniref:Amino-acid acetyltransferase, mitochondrial n=1 Tax=Phyllosticta capitalensis TaxID=121624 RepID=A0ABR1Z0Z5_9PEZI
MPLLLFPSLLQIFVEILLHLRTRNADEFLQQHTSEANEPPFAYQRCPAFARSIGSSVRYESHHDESPAKPHAVKPEDIDHEREFILSVLSTSATKRDARSFLARYDPQTRKKSAQKVAKRFQELDQASAAAAEEHNGWRLKQTGVNLGTLYKPSKAMQETPVFTHQKLEEKLPDEKTSVPLHIALVKVRAVDLWDPSTLYGVSLTLGQLVRLGLSIAVVVDPDEDTTPEVPDKINNEWRAKVNEQAHRLVHSLRRYTPGGAVCIHDSLSVSPQEQESPSPFAVRGGVQVEYPNLLIPLLQGGVIPVIPPIAYTKENFTVTRVQPDDVLLALTREFSGINKHAEKKVTFKTEEPISLERIIVLDPLGGIPFPDRNDRAHVFINLEQEYPEIRQDLIQAQEAIGKQLNDGSAQGSILGSSNPFSQFTEQEIASLPPVNPRILDSRYKPSRHLKNLDLVQRSLAILPPSSSAIIITPTEVAISATARHSSTPGVQTRRQKNPLIHNLLTDKPMVSSSHPDSPIAQIPDIMPATFVKRGMPLTVIPDPRREPWRPPKPGETTLSLDDPRIDIPRLVHLIEDSFGRKLNVQHYLNRVKNKLAGIIIAGEYEGGAIITWEDPPPSSDPNAPPRQPVPYLDKFAVLKRCQGSGGVADIVFKAMVRGCLPDGVVWRSRRDNPVNKWYFERSTGTQKLAAWDGSLWTMFWTTEGVEKNHELWRDYKGVCRGIRASWKDSGAPD